MYWTVAAVLGVALSAVAPAPLGDARDVVLGATAVDVAGQPFGVHLTITRSGPDDPGPVEIRIDLPSTVDVESVPASCKGTAPITCVVGVVGAQPVELDLLLRPRDPGPHLVTVALTSTDDVPAGNTAAAEARPAVVCDNRIYPTGGTAAGSDGDDVLCGGDGPDAFAGGLGDDLIFGGGSNDSISYGSSPGPMVVDLRIQDLSGPTAWPQDPGTEGHGHDTVTGVEFVNGTMHRDTLIGNDEFNILSGHDRGDLLLGLGQEDDVYGGKGRDVVRGGDGNDRLVGGTGRDRVNGGPGVDDCAGLRDVLIGCERTRP